MWSKAEIVLLGANDFSHFKFWMGAWSDSVRFTPEPKTQRAEMGRQCGNHSTHTLWWKVPFTDTISAATKERLKTLFWRTADCEFATCFKTCRALYGLADGLPQDYIAVRGVYNSTWGTTLTQIMFSCRLMSIHHNTEYTSKENNRMRGILRDH